MSLKGAENLTFFGENGQKYVVTEMYLENTNTRAFEVYYTDKNTSAPVLIWKYSDEYEPVPFDYNTCSLVILTDAENKNFTIKVYKDYGEETQEDISRSLKECEVWIYLHDDILPNVSVIGYRISPSTGTWVPASSVIPNDKISSFTINPLTINNGILGTYHIDAAHAKSIANPSGTQVPQRGSVGATLSIPFGLEEKTSLNASNVWLKVSAMYDISVGTVSFPATYTNAGAGNVYVINKDGIGIFNGYFNGTPSVTQKTVSGVDYNYIVYDVSALQSKYGNFFLEKNQVYYMNAYYNQWGSNAHPFARTDTKIFSELGYSTNFGSTPNTWYDMSSYTCSGEFATEPELVGIAQNTYAKYTGTSHNFTNGTTYVHNSAAVNVTDTVTDYEEIYRAENTGEVYYYTGSNQNYGFYQYHFYEITTPIDSVDEDDVDAAFTDYPVDTIIYWLGTNVQDVFTNKYYYKVLKVPTNFKGNFIGTSSGLPDYTTVSVGDTFLGHSYYDSHYTFVGGNGTGLYTVTAIDTDTSMVTISREAVSTYMSEVTDSTIRTCYSDITSSLVNSFTRLDYKDMSNVTDQNDVAFEMLLTAKTE